MRYVINFLSEINLFVKGNGEQRFLSDDFYLEPSEVKVNKDSCKKVCEFEGEENNVTLYFNVPIN